MNDLTGQQIDRYRIIKRLGVGGMAVVHKANETHLKCEIALKLFRRD